MRRFDSDFKKALRERVEAVEQTSGVELVVTILPKAGHYRDVHLGVGLVISMTALSILMFVEREFWYVWIYLETVLLLGVGIGLPWLFPGLQRRLAGPRMARNTQMHTRAIFQQAGITETRARTGVLVAYYWLERRAVVVADRGAMEMLPPSELDALQKRFQASFASKDVAEDILKAVAESQPRFAKYIPLDIHRDNELPDELWLS